MKIPGLFVRIGALFCLAACLTACRPELDFDFHQNSQASFSGSGENYTVLFDAESGVATIDLNASGSWTAEFVNGRAYWCTLSAMEGKRGVATLTFSVQSNGEYDERSAAVVFTCKDLKRTIVVTQKQRDALLLSSGRVEMSADGGSFTVEVLSNIDFSHQIEANGQSWIRTLSTKGLEKSVLTFQVDQNESLDKRIGTVTFAGPTSQETVTVYQKGETPTIVISEDTVSLTAEEGVFKVEVASNIDATLQVPEDCDWLREIQTKTISTHTYQFAYDRNQARTARTCYLVFRNEAFKKVDSVQVEQGQVPILKEVQDVYIPSTGDVVTLATSDAVQSFDQFHYDATWFEPAGMESDPDGNRFSFRVGPNPEQKMRAVPVSVSIPGFAEPDVFQVRQYGPYPSFSYVTTEQEVVVPKLDEGEIPYLVFWGDGSYERYTQDLQHRYESAGTHTIRFEGNSFLFLLLPAPQDGMRYDFSHLNLP